MVQRIMDEGLAQNPRTTRRHERWRARRNQSPAIELLSRAHCRLSNGLAPYFGDWLAHPDYDSYWSSGPSKRITAIFTCRFTARALVRHFSSRNSQKLHAAQDRGGSAAPAHPAPDCLCRRPCGRLESPRSAP